MFPPRVPTRSETPIEPAPTPPLPIATTVKQPTYRHRPGAAAYNFLLVFLGAPWLTIITAGVIDAIRTGEGLYSITFLMIIGPATVFWITIPAALLSIGLYGAWHQHQPPAIQGTIARLGFILLWFICFRYGNMMALSLTDAFYEGSRAYRFAIVIASLAHAYILDQLLAWVWTARRTHTSVTRQHLIEPPEQPTDPHAPGPTACSPGARSQADQAPAQPQSPQPHRSTQAANKTLGSSDK